MSLKQAKTVETSPPKFVEWRDYAPVADPAQVSREFYETMRRRRSVRAFSDRPVPKEVIENSILTAGTAPNGAHMQPWYFVAVSDAEKKREIRVAAEKEEELNYSGRLPDSWLKALEPFGTNADKSYLEVAPWLIAVFTRTHHWQEGGDHPASESDKKVSHYYINESTGIAVGMLLASLHLAGLATLTHTPSPMKFLRDILDRPAMDKPYLLIPVGYPAADLRIPDLRRKKLGEIARFV